MSILFLGFFLLILVSPGILIAGAPARCVRLVAALTLLPLGLLWLDEHVATVAPYDDDGPFYGIGQGIVLIMCLSAGAGILKRGFVLLQDDPDEPRYPVDQLWPVPLGILAAALFLHWLSNRLAGAQPASMIHIGLVSSGLVLATVSALAAWRWVAVRAPSLLLAGFAISFACMVANDALKGSELWRRAKEKAGRDPHCIMTYGGWEHRRVARDGWELSPLVNRHYGTWAAAKAPVVIIGSQERPQQLRWLGGEFRLIEGGSAPCEPA